MWFPDPELLSASRGGRLPLRSEHRLQLQPPGPSGILAALDPFVVPSGMARR